MFQQITINDITMPMISVNKKIRLIELFAGYGPQAMALRRIGADFENYRVVEFDKYAIDSYNAVHGTNFEPIDIRDVHGDDLGIVETDKYTYILTYSFPCTDLSKAGRQQGMSKDSGTRSGLLWEVERILNEIKEKMGELPFVLFMENVPQVCEEKNINDFHEWQWKYNGHVTLQPLDDESIVELQNLLGDVGDSAYGQRFEDGKACDECGCNGCAFEDFEEWEMPCTKCKRGCKDYWRMKND